MFSACSLFDDNVEYFRVEVYDLTVSADTISTDDTLEIRLLGTIGGSTCYSFDRFIARRESQSLELSIRGKMVKDAFCFTVIVPLDTIYKVIPPFTPGIFKIEILQPENIESLRDSVVVE